jgi:Ca-activated chloride channel family protein
MNFDPDDPRLTAYALGELEGADRAAIEALIARDEGARRFVDETRALAAILTERLRAESAPGLAPVQRRAIEDRVKQAPAVIKSSRPAWMRWVGYGVAASALGLVASVTYLNMPRAREAARRPTVEEQARAATPLAHAQRVPITASNEDADRSAVADHLDAVALTKEVERALARDELTESLGRGEKASESLLAMRENARRAGGVEMKDGAVAFGIEPSSTAPPSAPDQVPALEGFKESAGQPVVAEIDKKLGDIADAEVAPRQQDRFFYAQKPGQQAGLGGGAQALEQQVQLRALLARRLRLSTPATGPAAAAGDTAAAIVPTAPTPAPVADQLGAANERRKTEPALRARLAAEPHAEQREDKLAQLDLRAREAEVPNERYARIVENRPTPVVPGTLSTFAVDVDTASYSNIRRFLTQNAWPPADAIRIEEMINYFTYDYPEPSGDVPFSVNTEVVPCPWNAQNSLLRIGLKGRSIDFENRKPTNLVLLVDTSGSMNQPNKLPLVKTGLRMLAEQLGENDKLSIVTYAGTERIALPATNGSQKEEILSAIDQLESAGSTNAEAGYKLAFDLAVQNFIPGGVNRVLLNTDGDFNVGMTHEDDLVRMAEAKAKSGVFLNVLGYGEGNLKETNLEQMANKGNGQYAYVDTLSEAKKVFIDQIGGTLLTIAKDVKVQVDFNPVKVGGFRLVGYENRALENQDFRNDAKDAGEIGSGHTVTALYELMPPMDAAVALGKPASDSKYVKLVEPNELAMQSNELLTVRLRYKEPDGDTAREIEHPVSGPPTDLGKASPDTRFAAAVAMFGLVLRNSEFKGSATLDAVLELAQPSVGQDKDGYRAEFVELVKKAQTLMPR